MTCLLITDRYVWVSSWSANCKVLKIKQCMEPHKGAKPEALNEEAPPTSCTKPSLEEGEREGDSQTGLAVPASYQGVRASTAQA